MEQSVTGNRKKLFHQLPEGDRQQADMEFRVKLITILLMLTVSYIGITKASSSSETTDTNLTKSQHNYLVAQSAGYLGFIAAGMGRDYQGHTISTLLGYVPEGIGGVEIWQLSLKYEWHPFTDLPVYDQNKNIRLDPFYVGMSLIYGMHTDLFVDEPKHYPDGYYPPTALRSTLNMGIALLYGKQYTLFLEYTVLDTGLVAYVRHPDFFIDNYDYFGLEGIGSLAIGIKIKLE